MKLPHGMGHSFINIKERSELAKIAGKLGIYERRPNRLMSNTEENERK